MKSNSHIKAFLGDIEKAIDAVSPQIASLPDITLQEDWEHYRDRPKKQKISMTGGVIEIFCNYEAIAMILCDRLIQTNSIFKEWGVEEIHIFFGDRAPTKVYID